jgi:hypothetical protein
MRSSLMPTFYASCLAEVKCERHIAFDLENNFRPRCVFTDTLVKETGAWTAAFR